VLNALLVAALLSVSDPPGDAVGGGALGGDTLTAPTATLFRQRDAFDVRSLTVLADDTVSLQLGLSRVSNSFPQAILELYLSDTDRPTGGTHDLLPGSQLRLPTGASWRYAFRIVGTTVQVFDGEGGAATDITEASGAQLRASGDRLTLTTELPLPQRFSVYGMSGSYDPFSESGWRTLRETPSPWGFSGTAPSPVLDIIAESAGVQQRALAQGVLPEIRASFAQPGWLAVTGIGTLIALAGVAARFLYGRRAATLPPAAYLAPLSERAVRQRAKALRALAQGQGKLTLVASSPAPEAESAPPEPVMK
jgi:hypothetical protein